MIAVRALMAKASITRGPTLVSRSLKMELAFEVAEEELAIGDANDFKPGPGTLVWIPGDTDRPDGENFRKAVLTTALKAHVYELTEAAADHNAEKAGRAAQNILLLVQGLY